MKKYIDYPTDIKKDIEKRLLNKILLFMFSVASLTVLYSIFGFDYITTKINKLNAVLIYIIIFLFVFYSTKLYTYLLDRSWEGTVIKVKVATVVDSCTGVNPSRQTLYKKNVVIALIDLGDGKIIEKQIRAYRRNNESREIVEIGDTIRHFKGCKFNQVISKNNKSTCSCVMCGTINPCENKKCQICKFSMMD